MKLLTIFTPTYNRKNELKNLYNSLKIQTYTDFTWLIVDDGSSDNTIEEINKWKSEGQIRINYYYQENSGKHVAHNRGVELTDTDLFFCVDSDDILYNNAIEIIINLWDKLKNDDEICGIVAPRKYNDKNVPFPNIEKSKLRDLYKNHKYSGETCLIYKTNIIRNYPFPIFKGEKFLSEVAAYDEIDNDYEYLLLNEALAYGFPLEDGYTKNLEKLMLMNPKGYAYIHKNKYKYQHSLRQKIYHIIRHGQYSLLAKNWFFVNESPNYLLSTILIPVIIIRYRDSKKRKTNYL